MILGCPSCGTRYQIDPAAMGATGRQVRCTRCGHIWRAVPEAEQAPAAASGGPAEAAPAVRAEAVAAPSRAAAETEPTASESVLRRRKPIPYKEPRRLANWAGWAALAVIVAAIIGGGVVAREQIVAVWPPASKLYELVGLSLPETATGLELRNVRSARESVGGDTVLLIEGEIVNVSASVQDIPVIVIALRDADEREIDRWTVSLPQSRLLPGEVAAFASRKDKLPPETKGLVVRFEPAD